MAFDDGNTILQKQTTIERTVGVGGLTLVADDVTPPVLPVGAFQGYLVTGADGAFYTPERRANEVSLAPSMNHGVQRWSGVVAITGADTTATVQLGGAAIGSSPYDPATDVLMVCISSLSGGSSSGAVVANTSAGVLATDLALTLTLDAAPGAGEATGISYFIP